MATSASARKRAEAAQSLRTPPASLGALALAATIAHHDWSGAARAAALSTVSSLLAAGPLLAPAASASAPPVVAALTASLCDPHPPVRAAAYAATAAAMSLSPSPGDAFSVLCAALAIETDADVREAAFDTLAAGVPPPEHPAHLLTALRRDTAHGSLDSALAAGEFAGVLADGVDDPCPRVSAAALCALGKLTRLCRDPDVAGDALRLATRALRGENGDVRLAALGVMVAGAGRLAPVGGDCARALVRELRRRGKEAAEEELLCRVLRERRIGNVAAFSTLARALEAELTSARAAEEGGRANLLCGTMEGLVARNAAWAQVADLARPPSDKFVTCWLRPPPQA
jgi:hypothetical protein